MAAINKKLIHFEKGTSFDNAIKADSILKTSICFIKDRQQIYTHKQLYNCIDELGGTNLLSGNLMSAFGPYGATLDFYRKDAKNTFPPVKGMPVCIPSMIPEYFAEKTFDRGSSDFPGPGRYTLSFYACGHRTTFFLLHMG